MVARLTAFTAKMVVGTGRVGTAQDVTFTRDDDGTVGLITTTGHRPVDLALVPHARFATLRVARGANRRHVNSSSRYSTAGAPQFRAPASAYMVNGALHGQWETLAQYLDHAHRSFGTADGRHTTWTYAIRCEDKAAIEKAFDIVR